MRRKACESGVCHDDIDGNVQPTGIRSDGMIIELTDRIPSATERKFRRRVKPILALTDHGTPAFPKQKFSRHTRMFAAIVGCSGTSTKGSGTLLNACAH
jgi:hypothetical protein